MSWEQRLAEMRARVDPRLAQLPPALQEFVRSSRWYRSAGGTGSSYSCERMVDVCEVLAKAGAASQAQILGALEHPRVEVREAARRLLRFVRWRRAAPILLRQFQARPQERPSLVDAFPYVDSRLANKQLVEWMTSHPDPDFRADAALALILVAMYSQNHRLAAPFLSVLRNEAEEDNIRAHVIEGLAYILSRPFRGAPLEKGERHKDRRSSLWRTCTETILPYLSHPNPRFRWEAAFALGQARCRKALPLLREIVAHDQGLSYGDTGRPVAEEAAEAIESI